MAKRRSTHNDSDSERSSPAPKRSRLGDATNAPEPTQKIKAAAKKAAQPEDEAPADSGEDISEDEDDEMLEVRIQEVVRAKLESQKDKAGRIAEFGVIETLYMTNFMCHARLGFGFGPQMNFIIGHNGSGKSAALSALTIALGGKTGSTGRGNGLKSFIKEGQTQATVKVGIKNGGDDAYRPDVYGARIYIERRFTKEGASSYRITSAEGRLVSTKRSELNAICDHMNIQVDNPLNILTQDAARQFLSASNARDKYSFFIKGTQLESLMQSYDVMADRIESMKRQHDVRREGLADLKDKRDRATKRFEQANRAREMKDEKERLGGELAWAFVAEKRLEVEEAIKPMKKARRAIEKIVEAEKKAQEELEEAERILTDMKEDLPSISDKEKKELQSLNEQMRKKAIDIRDVENDIKDCSSSMTRIQKRKADAQRAIAAETAKLAAQTQGIFEEYQKRVQDKKDEIEGLQHEMSTAEGDASRAQGELDAAKREGGERNGERDRQRERAVHAEEGLRRASEQKRSEINVYGGASVQRVLDEIPKMRWAGEREPLGPVGMFVQLREGSEAYGPVLRNVLGPLLRSWVVSDARDLMPFKQLLKRCNADGLPVTVAPVDIFDYSRGEPAPDVSTMLRALEIKDEWVTRVLINSAHIESRALAPDRMSAERLLDSGAARGQVYTADEFMVRRYSEGGSYTEALRKVGGNDPRAMMLQSRSGVESFMATCQQDLDEANNKLRSLDAELLALREKVRNASNAYNNAKAQVERLRRRLNSEHSQLARLQNEMSEAAPTSVLGLDDRLKEVEEEETAMKAQSETMFERRRVLVEEMQPLRERADELRKIQQRAEEEARTIQNQIEEATQARMAKQKALEHWAKKKAAEEKIIDESEKRSNLLGKELLQWTEGAKELCPQEVAKTRSSKVLKARIESLERAVQDHEREQGASLDEISREVTEAQRNYDEEKEQLSRLNALNGALDHGLSLRMKKWYQFRKHIAVRCKYQFQYHLMNRGFFGKIMFDHNNAKLSLRVQTEDAQSSAAVKAAKGVKDKDPRSLSGGEKSFSTICLLLALWESIGCPIRCLDEFDVFMDAVNRRVSIKMLIDTANASDAKQYVLISPQALSNVEIKDSVKVLRMDDPERGQAQ